jgi:flagellar motor switch protein FliM
MVENAALRRKVMVGQRFATTPETESAVRGWRIGLARAAMALLNLPLEVVSVDETRRRLAELVEIPPERALIAVLEGPEHGLGMIAISAPMLAALIEVQTVGRVIAGEPAPRRPTRTDAAMSVEMINRALAELEMELTHSPDLRWAGGYRYASFMEDARPLGLLLEDKPFRMLEAELDIGPGVRRGKVWLALPAEGRGPVPAPPRGAHEAEREAARLWTQELSRTVMEVEAPMEAVIGRLRLSLRQMMHLRADDLLAIESGGVDRVALTPPGGAAVASCRLGQSRGMRAVRINPAEPLAGRDVQGSGSMIEGGRGGSSPAF